MKNPQPDTRRILPQWEGRLPESREPSGIKQKLPENHAHSIVVQHPRIIVGQSHHLTAFAEGKPLWQQPATGYCTALTTLPGNEFIASGEGHSIVIRHSENGNIHTTLPFENYPSALTLTESGKLAFYVFGKENNSLYLADFHPELHLVRIPLKTTTAIAPASFGNTVLVSQDDRFSCFSTDGTLLFSAGQHGFCEATNTDRSEEHQEKIETAVMPVNAHTLVAGFSGHNASGFFVFDTLLRQVKQLVTDTVPLQPILPAAIIHHAGEPLLLGCGTHRMPMLTNLSGHTLWTHKVVTPPIQILPHTPDTVLTVHSPKLSNWHKYRGTYQEIQCFIRCMDLPTGLEKYTIEAPGPISPCVTLSPEGILAVSENQLFILS